MCLIRRRSREESYLFSFSCYVATEIFGGADELHPAAAVAPKFVLNLGVTAH